MTNLRVFDLEEALDHVGGEHSLLVEVAQTCLSDYEEALVQIRAALKASDGKQLEKTAHKLKGSLLTLAAYAASDAAQSLENLGNEGIPRDAGEALSRLENEMKSLTTALESLLASL